VLPNNTSTTRMQARADNLPSILEFHIITLAKGTIYNVKVIWSDMTSQSCRERHKTIHPKYIISKYKGMVIERGIQTLYYYQRIWNDVQSLDL
jgi:hypothetical protein